MKSTEKQFNFGKEVYETPTSEVVIFESKDVIATSTTEEGEEDWDIQ